MVGVWKWRSRITPKHHPSGLREGLRYMFQSRRLVRCCSMSLAATTATRRFTRRAAPRTADILSMGTPNPQAMKFEHPSLRGGRVLRDYTAAPSGDGEPPPPPIVSAVLASDDGVASVFEGQGFVTVTLAPREQWDMDREERISQVVQAFLEEGEEAQHEEKKKGGKAGTEGGTAAAVAAAAAAEAEAGEEEGGEAGPRYAPEAHQKELWERIDAVIEKEIRPHVQADGGDVEMCGLGEDGTVSLAMVGACASCPSSTVTLRFMIRNLLLFRFPEEVTDVKGVFAEDDGRDFGL